MLKSAALLVMLVAAPAFAQEAGARTDFATVKRLVTDAATVIGQRTPTEAALSITRVNLSDEIVRALRASRENRLKVAPR